MGLAQTTDLPGVVAKALNENCPNLSKAVDDSVPVIVSEAVSAVTGSATAGTVAQVVSDNPAFKSEAGDLLKGAVGAAVVATIGPPIALTAMAVIGIKSLWDALVDG